MSRLSPLGAMALVVLTAAAFRRAWGWRHGRAVAVRLGADGGVGASLAGLPPAPARVAGWLEAAGVERAPAIVWWAWLAALGVSAVVAAVAGGPAMAILAVAAWVAGSAVVLRAHRGRGAQRLETALPGALEAVARSLRSGASLRQAVAEAAGVTPGALGRELAAVARQVDHGGTLLAAVEGLGERRPSPGVGLAVAALCLAIETGGAQGRAIDGVAATLRDRAAIASDVRALASQARLSALVIGLAPVAFGGFAVSTDPRTGQFLFRTPVGVALLVAGLVLDGLGWLWMQRLTQVAT